MKQMSSPEDTLFSYLITCNTIFLIISYFITT